MPVTIKKKTLKNGNLRVSGARALANKDILVGRWH